jgi:ABC-type sugar transport system substrate-binding protein
LLGNGNQSDPSLNTSDCGAVLLGSTRYQRGENMFYFINQKFPDNNSKQVIVEGIGHNGQAMYQSTEFRDLLNDLLDQ